jgi:Zn-dependent peptidase ImmA (M78 family)/DNA-binding XRE family transcriptional regulator
MMNLFTGSLEAEFCPSRLRLARMRRGLKQEELAQRVGLDKTTISKYERGDRTPDAAQAVLLADCLHFPLSFFSQSDVGPITMEGVSFRARRSEVKAATRERTLASLQMASQVLEATTAQMFRLPSPDLPGITGVPPDVAADRLRSEWNLGSYPIPNMVHLLEAKGIRVYWFHEDDPSVDAVSKVQDSVPFALLSQRPRGGERMRFDLAHELGHLVMHRGQREFSIKQIEDEANAFAAAFLVPEDAFRKECPRYPSLLALLNLKSRWGISLQALIHRCYALGIYSESQYKNAFRKINARGWRTHEPEEMTCEESKVWEQVFRHFEKTGVRPEHFAARMHIHVEELHNLVPYARKYTPQPERPLADHYLDLDELGYTFTEAGG